MLLVDDDQLQARQRHEDGQPRAEHDLGLSRKRVDWSEEQEAAEPPADDKPEKPKQKASSDELKGGLGESGPLIK